MLKKITKAFLLLFLSYQVNAQEIVLMQGIDTTHLETKQLIQLWKNYLASNPDSVYDNPYWNQEEKSKYEVFDLLLNQYYPSIYILMQSYYPTLLSITPYKEFFEIKTLLAYADTSGYSYPLAIINVYAGKENGKYKLYNALYVKKKYQLQYRKMGVIDYYFPKDISFNEENGKKALTYIDSLALLFKVPQKKVIEYYFTENQTELFKIRGFEYCLEMSNGIALKGGKADVRNGIVYSGGQGEDYLHELTHLILNPYFPNSHAYFLEGLATLYCGSQQRSLQEHIIETNNYLENNPKMNIADTPFYSWKMPNGLNQQYVLGGLFCQLAIEQGGINKLKNLMNHGTKAEDFFLAIEKEFGVTKEGFNIFFRQEITKRSM